jgi:hypothetical protein
LHKRIILIETKLFKQLLQSKILPTVIPFVLIMLAHFDGMI